jgi:putative transposase
MRRSRYSDQQIALALQQVENGASVAEVCRKLGVAEQTHHRWKRKFDQLAPSEIKKIKQLEDENRRLKSLVANLTLDKQMLHEVLRKKD